MNPEDSVSPPPAPFTRAGVTDYLTELFHEEIRSGRWAVGTKIPVESELVSWTGAGRNSVREAVQSLVQAGLLRREQGRGTFVIARSQLTQTLQRRLSSSARRDGLELRFAIDGATAALAAERRTDDDVRVLRELLDARARSWEQPDIEQRMTADTALHRAVVAATHNELFVELYDGLLELFRSVLRADVQGDVDEHARLVQAIVDQDARAARAEIGDLLTPLIEHGATPPDATTGTP
jgi:DNA-binding FadR family transcriptional regulator